jgi:hypothetical protein
MNFGWTVGCFEGIFVGPQDGLSLGIDVGCRVGWIVGLFKGDFVGCLDGRMIGFLEGWFEG